MPYGLELEYRAGLIIRETFIPPTEWLREIKICEICSKSFFRKIQLKEDSDGILRNCSPVICSRCQEITNRQILVEKIDEQVFQDAKDQSQRYRRRGAPHPVDGQVHHRESSGTVMDRLTAEFQIHQFLTAQQLCQITGWKQPGPCLVYYKNLGLKIVTDHFERTPGQKGRGHACYRLDSTVYQA